MVNQPTPTAPEERPAWPFTYRSTWQRRAHDRPHTPLTPDARTERNDTMVNGALNETNSRSAATPPGVGSNRWRHGPAARPLTFRERETGFSGRAAR
jgi:hypothetical protein